MRQYRKVGAITPKNNTASQWVDGDGFFNERVILTYVNPIDDYSSNRIEQCMICQSNGFVKVAYDMFRELNTSDCVTGKVSTYSSVSDLTEHYVIRKDLLWKETVYKKRLLKSYRRKPYPYRRKYYGSSKF